MAKPNCHGLLKSFCPFSLMGRAPLSTLQIETLIHAPALSKCPYCPFLLPPPSSLEPLSYAQPNHTPPRIQPLKASCRITENPSEWHQGPSQSAPTSLATFSSPNVLPVWGPCSHCLCLRAPAQHLHSWLLSSLRSLLKCCSLREALLIPQHFLLPANCLFKRTFCLFGCLYHQLHQDLSLFHSCCIPEPTMTPDTD